MRFEPVIDSGSRSELDPVDRRKSFFFNPTHCHYHWLEIQVIQKSFFFNFFDFGWGAKPPRPTPGVSVFSWDGKAPANAVLSMWLRRPNGAASIKCFFFGAIRLSLAFDRGGYMGPPRSNALFFGGAGPEGWSGGLCPPAKIEFFAKLRRGNIFLNRRLGYPYSAAVCNGFHLSWNPLLGWTEFSKKDINFQYIYSRNNLFFSKNWFPRIFDCFLFFENSGFW